MEIVGGVIKKILKQVTMATIGTIKRSHTVTTKDALKKMTLVVKINHMKSTEIRFKIGIYLIKLAASVIGCGIEIEKK